MQHRAAPEAAAASRDEQHARQRTDAERERDDFRDALVADRQTAACETANTRFELSLTLDLGGTL